MSVPLRVGVALRFGVTGSVPGDHPPGVVAAHDRARRLSPPVPVVGRTSGGQVSLFAG
ncbi:hypothetical protein [Saccharothrix lopnurensis]|uniref:Uncharacterized protein n=1 Tax=Saccharothrix lopnurensis TaxID=1670621 RepID=A0ABW1P5D6_9PSEU